METPKVCIIMPVYNGQKTIELALKSLFAQTYSNWECVIVNDGSTDGTRSILDSLSDKRFKVIHLKKNAGRGAARQTCLNNAEGKYLAYLDADDFYHHDKLKIQVEFLEMNPEIDLVACRVVAFDTNYNPVSQRITRKTNSCFFKDGNKLSISMPTAMIRLDKAKTIRYNPRLDGVEDVDYFSRYLNKSYYANFDLVLMYYYTGSTTYMKILKFTLDNLHRGVFLLKRNFFAGAKVFFLSAIKLFIYSFAIPFVGVDFFIKRRGIKVSLEASDEYFKELGCYKDN